MPTATVQAVGTVGTGAGTCTPGVPAGTASGSLLVAAIGCLPDGAIATPSGYTNKLLDDDQSPGVALHYKKLSAAEGSPTSMSCGGGINNGGGVVLRIEDEDTAADPFWSTVSSASNGAGNTTTPAVSLGSDTPAGLLVWVVSHSAARDLTTIPTGFTRQTPTGSQRLHVCTKEHAGGSTGNVTGVISSGAAITAGMALVKNAVEILPTGVASTAAVGSPTVTPGAVDIAPGGIASTSALGSPTVTVGPVDVAPTGIGSTAALGAPTVTPGEVNVSPSGIASTSALGSPTVTTEAFVAPTGIGSTAAVGTPTATPGPVDIAPTGIASTASVGTPTVAVVRDTPTDRIITVPADTRTITPPAEARTVTAPAEPRTVTAA